MGDRHPEPHQGTCALLILEGREAQERLRRSMRRIDHAAAEDEKRGKSVARQSREEQVRANHPTSGWALFPSRSSRETSSGSGPDRRLYVDAQEHLGVLRTAVLRALP